MVVGWFKLFFYLTVVNFSVSAKQTGVQKKLNRYVSRLKVVEAMLEVDKSKLSEHAERLSMIQSILNDTTMHSVNEVDTGGNKQELSSGFTKACSNTCAESDINRILQAFHQEKVLNGRLREEISDLKTIVSGLQKDMTQTVDALQTIRNTSVSAEELCEHDCWDISEVKTDIQSFNLSIFNLTQQVNNVDGRAEMTLQICRKVDNKLQNTKFLPHSCKDIIDHGIKESGVYTVYPLFTPVRVFCDMDTDNGGWTVFQRRQDGSEDFYRDWDDYEKCFRPLDGEFWLSKKHISEMTEGCCYELRVDMADFEGNTVYAKYGQFQVLSKTKNYTLGVGGYSGNAGDSLKAHSGHAFTTKDRNNDMRTSINCAEQYQGAWWYRNCHDSNLNGLYLNGENSLYGKGITWYHWKHSQKYSLKMTEMKFRKI